MDSIILTSEEQTKYTPTYLIAENALSEITNTEQARRNINAASQEEFNKLLAILGITDMSNIFPYLVTLEQLYKNSKWYTSGPIETTVGFLEDGTILPSEISLQDIMNRIFYTSEFVIDVPESVLVNESIEVGIKIRHRIGDISTVKLYQNGILLKEFTYNFLEQDTILIMSNPITEDTEFKLEVVYDDKMEEYTKVVKCKLPAPIFIGCVPVSTLSIPSFEYFEDLVDLDPINNKLIQDIQTNKIKTKYNFIDSEYRFLLIALPQGYPDLEAMITVGQRFGEDSFDQLNEIYTVNGYSVNYKIYKYKQPLSSLNQTIIFKLNEDEPVQ